MLVLLCPVLYPEASLGYQERNFKILDDAAALSPRYAVPVAKVLFRRLILRPPCCSTSDLSNVIRRGED